MNKRTFLLLLLGCLFSSSGHADETPCASELKQATDSIGKPEYAQTSKVWADCQVQWEQQKQKVFAETRINWSEGLDPLAGGGWALLNVSRDGSYAVFGSRRHETRKGRVSAVWLRYELREPKSDNAVSYMSEVERTLYDCERIATKSISVVYYKENNLGWGVRSAYTYDEAKVAWTPVVPGTLGDSLLEWACNTHPAKAH